MRLTIQQKNDWLEMHGGARLDQRRVDLAVLLQAAQRDRGYIAMGKGQFLQLESQLGAQLSKLTEHLERHRRRLRIVHTGLEPVKELVENLGLPAHSVWKNYINKLERAQTQTYEPPEHLLPVLRPYQLEGCTWLSRLASYGAGAILADDMGLGKTLQMIALLSTRGPIGSQMVVAPTSVGSTGYASSSALPQSYTYFLIQAPNDTNTSTGPNPILSS